MEQLTVEELRQLPNTISITRQVAQTHLGLGLRAAFLMTANVGNMGVLQVGDLGIGKTKTLIAIKNIPFRKTFTRKFTMAGVKAAFNKYFSNSEVSWINFEMADMSEIVVENMLKVVCDILTDHECIHSTSHYDMNIQNSTISFLSACTYPIYNKLWRIIAWRGNFKDRILRYFCFAFKRKRINTADPRAVITLNFPKPEDIQINTSYFNEIVLMLEKQFSSERAFEYTERLLKGSASLNHRGEATDADAKFILLNRTNIEAEGWVASKQRLSGALVIDADALMIFSEALKRTGVRVKRFLEAPHYLEDTESVIEAIYKHPKLLKMIGDRVFPNAKLIAEQIAPQIRFEKFCLNHGQEYYRGLRD